MPSNNNGLELGMVIAGLFVVAVLWLCVKAVFFMRAPAVQCAVHGHIAPFTYAVEALTLSVPSGDVRAEEGSSCVNCGNPVSDHTSSGQCPFAPTKLQRPVVLRMTTVAWSVHVCTRCHGLYGIRGP